MASTTTVAPVGKEEKNVEGEETTEKREENIAPPPPAEEEEEEEDEEIEYYESSGEDEERPGGPFIEEICYDSSEPEDYLTETYKRYAKVIADSRGYDVPDRPKLKISDNIIHTHDFEQLERLSKIAINDYNDKNKTNYVYHSVEKGNMQPARGILYYITFRTTCAEGLQYFQARVLDGIPDEYVEECILKGKPEPMPNPDPTSATAKSTEKEEEEVQP